MKKKEYLFSDETGDAVITVYEVVPGIELVYYSVHMDELEIGSVTEGNLIEIQHCREGRIEQEFEDEFLYLMPGDLSVAMKTGMVKAYRFPLRHYHGIVIEIDVKAVGEPFRQMIREMGVEPMKAVEKLCGDKSCFIIRAEKYIEHIFSELYTVPESIREGYMKVKVLELLLVLSSVDMHRNQLPVCTLPKGHVRLAHQAAAYLSEHMDERVTIPELSRKLNVSDTQLKTVFKGVYGVPIFSYIRIQKMQTAAQMLIHTEKSITEIAGEFGYTNMSKFSSAFQTIIGETPRDFRKAHMK